MSFQMIWPAFSISSALLILVLFASGEGSGEDPAVPAGVMHGHAADGGKVACLLA